MTVGENIKALRKINNLSQSKLAKKLFVTPQAVSRWENGETSPDIETLARMANIFNCSIDDIARGDELSLKSYKAEQVYHLLCLVGGSFTTIFAILFTALMIVNHYPITLEIIYICVSMIFLVSILVFEVRSRKLKEMVNKQRLEKEKNQNEINQKN